MGVSLKKKKKKKKNFFFFFFFLGRLIFILSPHKSRVGISGTTAKSRQRKFVPSSGPGPFALVASSHNSQTKVGTLACFDFL